MSETWESVKSDARDALVEALEYQKDMLQSQNFDAGDVIHKVADGAVPVYTGRDIVKPYGGPANVSHKIKCAKADRRMMGHYIMAQGWRVIEAN